MKYGGPRAFTTNDPTALARELAKLSDEFARLCDLQQRGNMPQLEWGDIVSTSAALAVGVVTPVQPGATLTLSLPPLDPRNVGKLCGVDVRSTTGTVSVRPSAGGLLDGSTNTLTLGAASRVFLFIQGPTDWKGVAAT